MEDYHAVLSQTRLPAAQAPHRSSSRSPASAARASTTKRSSPPPASAAPTASPITCGRRRASARSSRPASMPLDTVEQPALRHHHLKTGPMKRGGDPITGRVPLLVNDDVIMARCRPAQPQSELYRNATHDELLFIHRGLGPLGHDVRRAAVQAIRLRRHPALHHLPARVRRRHAARPARHRVGRQHRHSAALPQPRRPAPPRRSLLRARPARADGNAGHRPRGAIRRSSSRTASG